MFTATATEEELTCSFKTNRQEGREWTLCDLEKNKLSSDSVPPASSVCQCKAGVSHATRFTFHPKGTWICNPSPQYQLGPHCKHIQGPENPCRCFLWTQKKPSLSAKAHTGLSVGANVSVASKAMWFWSSTNLIWSWEIKPSWPSCILLAVNNSDSKMAIICL